MHHKQSFVYGDINHDGDINPMITMTKGNYESDDYEYEKNEWK